ncbi:MAG: zinc ribbon domain-containing protein, partial [Christensenellales bacterium]
MFFIGVFGADIKQKKLREFEAITCGGCGRLTRAELVLSYSYFHVFFIPTFRWSKRYFIKTRCCGAVYEADADYANILLNASDIDFSRLNKIKEGFGGMGG